MLTFDDYQRAARSTAIYASDYAVNYPILGLLGEAGELANKYKKVLRDGNGWMSEEAKQALQTELGDVLWYCANLAEDLKVSLSAIAVANIDKLCSRKERGVLQGSGDNR